MIQPVKATHTRWLIISLVFVIYVVMFIDRVNISIAAKYIMPEYGLSDVQFGWIFSAFVFGYALAQIPGGWLGDRLGPRKVMTWAILWWSAFTAVTAIAGELFLTSIIGVVGSFALVRLLIGLGEAAAPPNGNRIVANWAPPRERALALGVAVSGSALGAANTAAHRVDHDYVGLARLVLCRRRGRHRGGDFVVLGRDGHAVGASARECSRARHHHGRKRNRGGEFSFSTAKYTLAATVFAAGFVVPGGCLCGRRIRCLFLLCLVLSLPG